MDQVYIPKQRAGFSIGDYVVIKSLDSEKEPEKPFLYNIEYIEPVKLRVVLEIFKIIDRSIENYENAIITGSFIEKGFCFNDVDILVIKEEPFKEKALENEIYSRTGLKAHVIAIDLKSLMKGLASDPIYNAMLSRCISKKRFIFNVEKKINYKALDLHLLKSKLFIDNFNYISGSQKYDMLRNMIAIRLFLDNKKISKEAVDDCIEQLFFVKIEDIKKNMIDKKIIKKYKLVYEKTFKIIMDGIKNEPKQE